MQPAWVGRYGAFTYSRIGTHDKSMFGLPVPCQMQCSSGEREEKERERVGERFLCAAFNVERLASPTIPRTPFSLDFMPPG
ncbi:hypothetical protein QLX08_006356 [Tetragonisca angustula]|uniref:Uncharacterized protein n=1 Tax=Tetragonisca angustula TaxID=166442 RepID=A0AAW0ZU91_9HYME